MDKIRTQDKELVTLLRNKLKDYTVESIPKEKLEDTVKIIIDTIRKNSRRREDFIYLDESCKWHKTGKSFFYKDKEIVFTNKERGFLALLFYNVNNTVTYNTICVSLWGDSVDPVKQERIKTLIKQIRKKLPKNIIKNIFGYGYKIEIS